MSIRHVAAVLDHYPNGDARKLVLIAIAEQANEATWVCWPSIERLAKRACVSKRHAQRMIDALEEEGVIDTVRGRGRKKPNRYRCRYDVLKAMPSLVDVDSPEDDPLAGFEPVDNTVQNPLHKSGHGVPNVQRKWTSDTRKVDIAMSTKPEEPEEDLHYAPSVEKPDHGQQLIGHMVDDLATAWSRV